MSATAMEMWQRDDAAWQTDGGDHSRSWLDSAHNSQGTHRYPPGMANNGAITVLFGDRRTYPEPCQTRA